MVKLKQQNSPRCAGGVVCLHVIPCQVCVSVKQRVSGTLDLSNYRHPGNNKGLEESKNRDMRAGSEDSGRGRRRGDTYRPEGW